MLARLYEQMLLIRKFEENLTDLFQKGLLYGTTHCCIGQEAVAVGVLNAITQDDIVVSNHRGHGHFIAFTDDVEGLTAEIMGRKTGVCGGRGGSQHLHKGNFYSNGITGGMVPVATGMAFAEKIKGSGRKVVAFLGDGALAQGVVYESWNMASLWRLPILYVIENNLYAMSTPISMHLSGSIEKRARAFDINVAEVSTNDVEDIYTTVSGLAGEINQRVAPQVLICHTYRFCGHSKSDDLSYQPSEEIETWLQKDPIKLAGKQLQREEKDDILHRVQERIRKAVERADEEGFQDPSVMLRQYDNGQAT
ncbi:MAG: thiamine pyrophosphate-dependent dehydrogenase E1 component subunit alpha [Deltaproteobacteria bacterium]|nr:thiamine pyrophosphate-dependent dehydrogenase E1 component subunit alpha [Deltaproteobacteria bacterium]